MVDLKEARRRRILQFVNDCYKRYRRSPSVREIEKHTSINRGSVYNYLRQMDEEGIIEYNGQTILTSEIRAMQRGCREVPVVGPVACGLPDQGDPFVGETMELPISLVGTKNDVFLFEAHGDSMIGAGIESGDLVLIRAQEEAYNRQIVLAEVEGAGLTLKRYMRKGRKMVLHPENPEMEDIEPDFFKIRGVALKAIKDL